MKKLEQSFNYIGLIAALGTVVLALLALVQVIAHALTPSETQIAAAPAAEIEQPAEDPADPAPQTATQGAPAAPEPAAPEPAAPVVSAAAGETVFRQCKACHTVEEGGRNGTGPNLWGVVGRAYAAVEGFNYSDAFAEHAGETWTVEQLDAYLADPRGFIPGNRMGFAGLRKQEDRNNVIAYLAANGPDPQTPAQLGFADAAGLAGGATPDEPPAVVAADATPEAGALPDAVAADAAEVAIDPVPWPEGVTYRDPEPRPAEEQAAVEERVAALQAEVDAGIDYERARFHPIHFPPAINDASNEECLICHQEILDHEPRAASPAGVPAAETIAWYQTLDTYEGDQASFHWRHMESDFAKQVMNLECTFCHQGNDPREESPDMMISRAPFTAPESPEFTLRKMVNPSDTCLRCHGQMPAPEEIMGLAGPWHEVRDDMEWPEAPNGCLSCHAELYRTVRHNVDYLKAHSIEEISREGSSDTCYGCHGGRAWYRISYPYPRHDWPDMFDTVMPDWAEGRPTESDARYRLPQPQTAAE